jgi:hypothetical protein
MTIATHSVSVAGGKRRQIRTVAEPCRQSTLQRLEDDCQDGSPENGAEERQQYPDQRDRHRKQQDLESFSIPPVVIHDSEKIWTSFNAQVAWSC